VPLFFFISASIFALHSYQAAFAVVIDICILLLLLFVVSYFLVFDVCNFGCFAVYGVQCVKNGRN